jgi:hypothetical protein
MRRSGYTWITLILLLLSVSARTQEVEFSGSTKSSVVLGETFSLVYTVNAQGSNFHGPSLSGFSILSGPFTSTTSSIRSINGRTSMSITYTFSYILQATKEGTFDLPPATVTVDNKVYKSNPLTIKVSRDQNSSQGNTGRSQQGNPQQGQGGGQTGANDVYVKAFVSNSNPIQGEGIVVTYKIFTKVPISQITINKLSSFSGFWSQNLIKENEKFNQYNQVIDGQQYVVAEIRKIALFPLKSGKLTIEPLELGCVAQVKRQNKTRTGDPFFDDFFNDSFFNNSVATVEKTLQSNAVTVNVRPLPSNDKPADFNGAVGSFTFRSEIDKTQAKTNDAINLKFVVTGQGNIQLIDKMNVTFPPDFETYDPKVTSSLNTGNTGVSGSQTFEYLMIPRKPGKFTIKPVTFSYFDLAKNRYISLTSPEYTINVERGSGDASSVVYTGNNKEDIKYIGSDIRFIKNGPFRLHPLGTVYFGTLFFYLSLLVPLLLFITFIFIWQRYRERSSDMILMKNLKATKIARKRLRKAEILLRTGEQDAYYNEISRALWGYLSDKFGIPLADLSMDSVHDALEKKRVGEDVIQRFFDALNNVEFARFAPGEKSMMMEKIYQETLDLISRTEGELK